MEQLNNETEAMEQRSGANCEATKTVVELAYGIELDEIADKTIERASDILCDGMGVLLHGIDHHTVRVFASYLKHRAPQNGVDVIGHSFRAALPDAAFLFLTALKEPAPCAFGKATTANTWLRFATMAPC